MQICEAIQTAATPSRRTVRWVTAGPVTHWPKSLPRWFHEAVHRAEKGPRGPYFLWEKAGNIFGDTLDHLGRLGDCVTFEPYYDYPHVATPPPQQWKHVPLAAAAADRLGCEVFVGDSPQWFACTTLLIFGPKGIEPPPKGTIWDGGAK